MGFFVFWYFHFFRSYGPLKIFGKISNRRHFIIYWWIFKSNGSKESCCGVEYVTYEKKYKWRISITFFKDSLNWHFCSIDTAYTIWVKSLKFGHNILQIICQKVLFCFLLFSFFSKLWPFENFKLPPFHH